MPTPTFPDLSRKPSLKGRRRTLDPTLRDPMENGMEADLRQWTRLRREYDVTIDFVTVADQALLDDFEALVMGDTEFYFLNAADPSNPKQLLVRFATLPQYQDKDQDETGIRFTCTFTLREF